MTPVNSTSQYLQQGLTNPEYSIVLCKTYPTKRKDSKDMLALRESRYGYSNIKIILQKSLLK
jgi:hypothetical protein